MSVASAGRDSETYDAFTLPCLVFLPKLFSDVVGITVEIRETLTFGHSSSSHRPFSVLPFVLGENASL